MAKRQVSISGPKTGCHFRLPRTSIHGGSATGRRRRRAARGWNFREKGEEKKEEEEEEEEEEKRREGGDRGLVLPNAKVAARNVLP